MLTALRERERVQLDRDSTTGAANLDSQSVRASERVSALSPTPSSSSASTA